MVSLSRVGATLVLMGLLTGCTTPKAQGPLFVAIIIDSSASVGEHEESILKYAKLALDEYCRRQTVHVAVINLDEDPTVEFQKEGDFYEEDIEDIIAHVEAIDSDARGTDVISAFELALQYYSYQKVPPAGLKILCFTDGHIDAPTGEMYRQWSDLDWQPLVDTDAGVGLYFVDTDEDLRAEIEQSLRPIANTVIKNENEAFDDLKWEEPVIP